MIKFNKITIKLALMAVLLAFLPFAGSFACPCDGTDDTVKTQTQDPESVQIQTRVQTQSANTTAQAEAASTDAVSDAGMSSDSPYINYPY